MRDRKKQRKAPSQDAKRKDWAWLPWADWGLAILLSGVALFFHFTFFTHVGALWRDEVHSVEFASLPSVSSTYESIQYDSFPLLSTLVLRGWIQMGWGSTDQGLRVFGFLVGAILLGVMWLTCRLLGCPTPLISVALVGLNPWVVRTADSIRPYGLGVALIVATLGCVWKAAETSRPKWFVVAGLLAVLSVQCMYQNAFLLFAICLGGAVVSLRGSRVKTAIGVVLVGLVAAVSLVPYLPGLAAAQSWGILVRSPVSMERLLDVLIQALGFGSVVTVWSWFGLAIFSGAVGIYALSRRRQRAARERSHLALFCVTVLVVATAAYLTGLKAAQLLTQPWYYVPLAVMVAPTLDATAWLAATTNVRRITRFAVVAAIACTMAVPGWRQIQRRWTNIDVVAAKVGNQATAEDTIVLNPFWIGITFQRYYKGSARWITIPPLEDVHIVRYDLVKAAMARPAPLDPALETIAKTLQSGHRVFWVQGLSVTESGVPPVLPPAPLPDTGWYIGPYLEGWARQAAYSLESHGLRADYLDARAGPMLGYENVTVTVVSGWR